MSNVAAQNACAATFFRAREGKKVLKNRAVFVKIRGVLFLGWTNASLLVIIKNKKVYIKTPFLEKFVLLPRRAARDIMNIQTDKGGWGGGKKYRRLVCAVFL